MNYTKSRSAYISIHRSVLELEVIDHENVLFSLTVFKVFLNEIVGKSKNMPLHFNNIQNLEQY